MKVKLRNPNRVIELPGPMRVSVLLKKLDIVPETVLVIQDGALLPDDVLLDDQADVEIRPVISGGSQAAQSASKCRVCRAPGVIKLRRHNAHFCKQHFLRFCRDQTAKAIAEHDMAAPDDKLLIAVSGGKDSLALWDILLDLGYRVDGLYVGLGIDQYSDHSQSHAEAFAASRRQHLKIMQLTADYDFDVPSAARQTGRPPCSACGLSKRHIFDEAAIRGGYDVLATGHNLDDEASVLMGNVLRWQSQYLARQHPVLPARGGFPKKIKPLVRLTERETAAYCVLSGIEYIVEECPMAAGNRHLAYKEMLNLAEERSPGTKHDFYHGFLRHSESLFSAGGDTQQDLVQCAGCGAPSSAEVCAFCRLLERLGKSELSERDAAQPGAGLPGAAHV